MSTGRGAAGRKVHARNPIPGLTRCKNGPAYHASDTVACVSQRRGREYVSWRREKGCWEGHVVLRIDVLRRGGRVVAC